jgi:hypothetical protein
MVQAGRTTMPASWKRGDGDPGVLDCGLPGARGETIGLQAGLLIQIRSYPKDKVKMNGGQ